MLTPMRFDHVGILVNDLEAACAFARDVLQLGEPQEVRVDEHGMSAAFFPLGAGRLELFRFDDPGDRLPPGENVRIDHVAVEVDDLDGYLTQIKKYPCQIISDPGVIPVKFRAPGGVVLEIVPKGRYQKTDRSGRVRAPLFRKER